MWVLIVNFIRSPNSYLKQWIQVGVQYDMKNQVKLMLGNWWKQIYYDQGHNFSLSSSVRRFACVDFCSFQFYQWYSSTGIIAILILEWYASMSNIRYNANI